MSIEAPIKTISNGLVLHLDAANNKSYPGSGTSWVDLSRNGNNGTLTLGPTFSSANGGSIVLDGTNDYVNIPFSSQFPVGSSARTLCAWFYATSVSGGREIFGIGGNTVAGSRSALWIDSTNIIGVECLNTGIFTDSWTGINTWVNLCATFETGGNTHSFKIYVNGIQRTTTTTGTAVTLNSLSTAATIGSVPGVGSFVHMFVGNIPQVLLYNRALAATEVLQNYNASKSRFGL
jgi:hypothetical protein